MSYFHVAAYDDLIELIYLNDLLINTTYLLQPIGALEFVLAGWQGRDLPCKDQATLSAEFLRFAEILRLGKSIYSYFHGKS